jgi:superfamily I DNA/RNA helicase
MPAARHRPAAPATAAGQDTPTTPAGQDTPTAPAGRDAPAAGDDPATSAQPAGLDPQQQAAAAAAGPLLIVAGPGTGKTRMLTHRIAGQISDGHVLAGQCLAITFTRRAAEEMRERLAALLGPAARLITVTTFHGLGLQILRENSELAGLPGGFGVADDAACLTVATELAGSAAAGRRMLAAAAGDPGQRAAFRAALAERGLVDFDSLVELSAALLRREPGLTSALRDRWRSVSVDEYQDIDERQYELLRLLTTCPDEESHGAGASIGDPDQAIYSFRGSDVGFFLRFGADYPDATTAELTVNYRSAPGIVAAALQAVAPATLLPGRVLHAAGPARAAGAAARAAVSFHEAPDERAEAEWIAAEIDRLLGGASFHSLDSGRADGHGQAGLGLANVAVLYRTDAQAGPLTQALTRAGLPFQKRSHDRLIRRAGVAEIVAEMRLTAADDRDQGGHGADAHQANPGADADQAGRGTDTDRGADARHASPGADAHRAGPGADADQSGRGTDTGRGADARHASPGRDAYQAGAGADAATASGPTVRDRMRAAVRRLAGQAQPGTAADIRAAGEILLPLADRCGRDMHRFLTEIAVGAEADALDPRAEAVTLLTLHAAKGLEFEAVFLAGCERGLLPLWIPGDDEARSADEAEERRLLFVGMTRARSLLRLSCATTRTRYGTQRPGGPSPFLAAIDPSLLHRSARPRPRRPAARQLRLI